LTANYTDSSPNFGSDYDFANCPPTASASPTTTNFTSQPQQQEAPGFAPDLDLTKELNVHQEYQPRNKPRPYKNKSTAQQALQPRHQDPKSQSVKTNLVRGKQETEREFQLRRGRAAAKKFHQKQKREFEEKTAEVERRKRDNEEKRKENEILKVENNYLREQIDYLRTVARSKLSRLVPSAQLGFFPPLDPPNI